MASRSEADDLWRIRHTIFEMLRDRGYIISPKYLDETKEQFESIWEEVQSRNGNRSDLMILATKPPTGSGEDQIIVFFSQDNKKVGVKPIRLLATKMEEQSLTKAILVVRQPLTSFAKLALQEAAPALDIEVFNESDLIVNITKHELVPQHIPLTAEEKAALLVRYKVKDTQLPRIYCHDPVARYFGMKKGNVLKIIRPSETAGKYVTYRLCV